MPMYFTRGLQTVVLPYDDPPGALWVRLRGDSALRPAWLLTPLTYALLFAKVAVLEDRYAAGQYPGDNMDNAYARWAVIQTYATARWLGPQLDAARGVYNANPSAHKLAEPPPMPYDAFPDDILVPTSVRYNGSTGKWEGAHGQEAIQ